ncbi:MAG: hypothetical protein KAX19_11115 [Candidatus Brocadiae bacterium]|nr:hypothetical protein [Candidatus Brocadiia bacterium]
MKATQKGLALLAGAVPPQLARVRPFRSGPSSGDGLQESVSMLGFAGSLGGLAGRFRGLLGPFPRFLGDSLKPGRDGG